MVSKRKNPLSAKPWKVPLLKVSLNFKMKPSAFPFFGPAFFPAAGLF